MGFTPLYVYILGLHSTVLYVLHVCAGCWSLHCVQYKVSFHCRCKFSLLWMCSKSGFFLHCDSTCMPRPVMVGWSQLSREWMLAYDKQETTIAQSFDKPELWVGVGGGGKLLYIPLVLSSRCQVSPPPPPPPATSQIFIFIFISFLRELLFYHVPGFYHLHCFQIHPLINDNSS